MFKKVIFCAILMAHTQSFANVLWDESVNGELTGVFGSGPIFNLSNGDNFVSGKIAAGSSVDPASLDFDIFSILLPMGTTLNSVAYVPGYTSTSGVVTLRWRIREGAQASVPFSNTINIGPATNSATIAAEVAAIPLDRAALTFNPAFAFTGANWAFPDHSYTWVFNASVLPTAGIPEPSAWSMLLFGFGFSGYSMRRARRQAIQRAAA